MERNAVRPGQWTLSLQTWAGEGAHALWDRAHRSGPDGIAMPGVEPPRPCRERRDRSTSLAAILTLHGRASAALSCPAGCGGQKKASVQTALVAKGTCRQHCHLPMCPGPRCQKQLD